MFVNTPTLVERILFMLKLFCPRGFALHPVLYRVSVSVSHRSKLTRDVTSH